MSFELDDVILYSRNLDEYRRMFAMNKKDFKRQILSVADGPASFSPQLAKKGVKVTSVDPIYAYSAKRIRKRFYQTFDNVFEQIRRESVDWEWNYYSSVDDMKAQCEKSFLRFIDNYGSHERCEFITGELPDLPFQDRQFDLVLCSHFLFLYEHILSLDFHWRGIVEMLRVGKEVRIYPLMNINAEDAEYLNPILLKLLDHGYKVELVPVDYQIRQADHKMLRIRH